MYLVFDVGGTFIKYAMVSEDGEIGEKGKTPAPRQPAANGLSDFLDIIVGIYEKNAKIMQIEGIAMSLPGQIDVENSIVYGGGALSYLDEVRLGDLLTERCDGVPVALENDGKCAALAEIWLGNAKDCENAVVIVCGTGVAGGIVSKRRVLHGKRMVAGELSYFLGNMTRKDLETMVPIESTKSVAEAIEKLPYIWSATAATFALTHRVALEKGLPLEAVSGEKVYEWAAAGDEIAMNALEDMYFDIARNCCTMQAILDPDIILVGGGISAQPAFIEGIKKYAYQIKNISKIYRGLTIDVCKFQNESNLLGALYNFKQKYHMIEEEV